MTIVHPIQADHLLHWAEQFRLTVAVQRLFFNQLATVWRETPRVRSKPLKLDRS